MRRFPELIYQLIHLLISLSDLLITLGPSNHNLPWDKNQKRHGWIWWLDAVNQTWEYLWLILDLATFLPLCLFLVPVLLQSLQMNWYLHITRCHNILHLKVVIVNLEAHSLNNFGVLATGQFAVLLRFGASDDHLSAAENQTCGFGVAKSHDDCGETIGVVLGGFAFPGDLLKVQLAAQVNSAYDVLNAWEALLRDWVIEALISRWH